jgi:hypothetical protein
VVHIFSMNQTISPIISLKLTYKWGACHPLLHPPSISLLTLSLKPVVGFVLLVQHARQASALCSSAPSFSFLSCQHHKLHLCSPPPQVMLARTVCQPHVLCCARACYIHGRTSHTPSLIARIVRRLAHAFPMVVA